MMPPPMFEKQITLQQGIPSCIYLYGHSAAILTSSQLVIFDCVDNSKIKSYDVSHLVNANEVYKMITIR
jgi:hypothetical protein